MEIVQFNVLPVTDPPRPQPPTSPIGWGQLVAQYHVRRALEVALAGNHSVLLIGPPEGQTQEWALWARGYGLDATAVMPCPCGHFGDPRLVCDCTLAEVQAHQKKYGIGPGALVPVDICIEVPALDPREVVEWVTGQRVPEAEAAMWERIEGMGRHESVSLDESCRSLLLAAVRQLGLMPVSVIYRIIAVARTIANLDHSEVIQIQHLAEAIQYRPRLR